MEISESTHLRKNEERIESRSLRIKGTSNNFQFVTPAQAGIQLCQDLMDSCFRRNDIFRGSLKLCRDRKGGAISPVILHGHIGEKPVTPNYPYWLHITAFCHESSPSF